MDKKTQNKFHCHYLGIRKQVVQPFIIFSFEILHVFILCQFCTSCGWKVFCSGFSVCRCPIANRDFYFFNDFFNLAEFSVYLSGYTTVGLFLEPRVVQHTFCKASKREVCMTLIY